MQAPDLSTRADGPTPKTPPERWALRIEAARKARDAASGDWFEYAKLHARATIAARTANDDDLAWLPNGDQVRLGLIHRNIEQTMAALEVEDPAILAEAVDATREQGREDEHREALVSQALTQSLRDSGLVTGPEVADMVRRDGLIVGHGVSMTCWRTLRVTDDLGQEPVYEVAPDGRLLPVIDPATGRQRLWSVRQERLVWEGCEDQYISPLDFLTDPAAPTIRLSRWHGAERIVPLEDLRADGRYQLPAAIAETEYKRHTIYGGELGPDEAVDRGVRVITCWDKGDRELVAFLEQHAPESADTGVGELVCILAETLPLAFDLPHDSPFSDFVPIPGNDDPPGISQVLHTRNPAVEADKLRTRYANLAGQMKRIFTYDRQSGISEEELATALRAPDYSVIALNNAMGQDIKTIFSELPTPSVHPAIFGGIQQAINDVAATSGVTDIPYGGASTATESENIMAVGAARIQRKRRLYLDYLARVARAHLAYRAAFDAEGQAVQVFGIDGMPLNMRYGRAAFAGRWNVRASPGGTTGAVSPVQRKADLELLGMIGPVLGPSARAMLLRQILTRHGWSNVNGLMRAVAHDMAATGYPLMPQQGGGAMVPDGRLLADRFNPNDQTNGQAIRGGINALYEGRMAG